MLVPKSVSEQAYGEGLDLIDGPVGGVVFLCGGRVKFFLDVCASHDKQSFASDQRILKYPRPIGNTLSNCDACDLVGAPWPGLWDR